MFILWGIKGLYLRSDTIAITHFIIFLAIQKMATKSRSVQVPLAGNGGIQEQDWFVPEWSQTDLPSISGIVLLSHLCLFPCLSFR